MKRFLVVPAVLAVASCAQPVAPRAGPASPSPAIVAKVCGGPTRAVRVMRNEAGAIGAYVAVPSILDSPIYYYDAAGKYLTMFHIFGPDSERLPAAAIVQQLSRDFPREEVVLCPGVAK